MMIGPSQFAWSLGLLPIPLLGALDYCLSLYSGLPSVRLVSLSRVLRSAARFIGQIPKFGHVSSYMLEPGGPSLAPHPTAYRIQGGPHGVAMTIVPCSNLLSRPLTTCLALWR